MAWLREPGQARPSQADSCARASFRKFKCEVVTMPKPTSPRAMRLVLAGRDEARSGGFVNGSPYPGSTVLFESLASLRAAASEHRVS